MALKSFQTLMSNHRIVQQLNRDLKSAFRYSDLPCCCTLVEWDWQAAFSLCKLQNLMDWGFQHSVFKEKVCPSWSDSWEMFLYIVKMSAQGFILCTWWKKQVVIFLLTTSQKGGKDWKKEKMAPFQNVVSCLIVYFLHKQLPSKKAYPL